MLRAVSRAVFQSVVSSYLIWNQGHSILSRIASCEQAWGGDLGRSLTFHNDLLLSLTSMS